MRDLYFVVEREWIELARLFSLLLLFNSEESEEIGSRINEV